MSSVTGTKRGSPHRTTLGLLWHSTIGKKAVMAVSGVVMLLFLVVHAYGNLKIFFGRASFDAYAHWLRTVGEPFLHHGWALWIARVVVAAAQLSRRDRAARPVPYVHRRRRSSYATHTMRWGGVIIGLFVVWHLLDLTTGTVNPRGQAGHPYENVVADFTHWWPGVVYLLALCALALHIQHGFRSAALTLGAGRPAHDRLLTAVGNVLAAGLFLAFASVPVGVMTGWVR
jgi:succinate dehydrogenase / fumarate reductase cytochrome b subunit